MKAPRCLVLVLVCIIAILFASTALGQGATPMPDDIIRGAQLYDKWYAVLGMNPPSGNMPIWSRQTTNTRSGADTWRCSECHGWDYRGSQGAFKSGSHFTGFPDVYILVQDLQVEDIIAHLDGEIDPAHDYSAYLDPNSISQLAYFLKFGLIDDTEYIDPISLIVIEADLTHGQQLYQSTCSTCHGEDGSKIIFGVEGVDEYLGSLAYRDPWRFLHRTRFGVAGTNMPVGLSLGWTPADGHDMLAYAQTLPTAGSASTQPTQNPLATQVPQVGGPANNLWTGILTSLGIVIGMGTVACAFIAGFILLALGVVVIFRKRGNRSS